MALRRILLAGASAAALAMSGTAALAQDGEPVPMPAPQEAPAPQVQVDEQKLESFAVAFLQVNEIAQQYQTQFESAQSDEDRQRLQAEAGQEMIQAVEAAEGITIQEYNEIVQAAQVDPELAQRINGYLTEAAPVPAPAPAE